METVLNYGQSAKLTQLTSQGFYPDESNMNSTDAAINPGVRQRRAVFGTYGVYKKVELIGKIHSDIFNIDRLLPSGIDMHVTLNKEKANFYMMGAGSTGDIKILEATLSVDHKIINPKILSAHHYTLNTKNMIIPFKKTAVKQFTINQGVSSVTLDNIILGRIPNTLIFGMVSHAAYNGDRTANPFNFTHNNIQSFSLFVNGEQIPAKPLYFDYTPNLGDISTRGYITLFKTPGIYNQDRGHQITKTRFDNGYFLLSFDLTADQDGSDTCINPIQEGSIRLEFKMAENLAAPITCLVYTETDAGLEIDRSKNVFVTQ